MIFMVGYWDNRDIWRPVKDYEYESGAEAHKKKAVENQAALSEGDSLKSYKIAVRCFGGRVVKLNKTRNKKLA